MKKEVSGTKICKHCKTEIPAGAKVCPNCRKKQGGKLKWMILAVVVVIVLAMSMGGGDDKEKKLKTKYQVGETANQDDVKITLKKVSTSKGQEFVKPNKGKEFVICEFLIENNSDDDITVSSELCFEAYVDDYSINQDFMGPQLDSIKNQKTLDGDVGSGKKLTGVIVYQAKKNWKTLEVKVQPDFWGKKVKFVYKNK